MKFALNVPFAIVACDVLQEEVESRVREMGLKPIAVRFLEMGKHDHPDTLRKDLQAQINQLEEEGCRRILFVYGLCSNSILGIHSTRAELVFPRAHDCITLYLGDRKRYAAIQKQDPGTYWFSPGWCRGQRVPVPGHMERIEAEFREKFDEDEVEYLMEMEQMKYAHYSVAAHTDLGDGDTENSKAATREAAEAFDMEFRHYEGDDTLLSRLLSGPWDEADFLVVPPGKVAEYAGDDSIIRCGECKRSL